MACASIQRVDTASQIRRTSNVEATKRCTFLVTVNDPDQISHLIPNDADPETYLVYLPAGGGVSALYDRCR